MTDRLIEDHRNAQLLAEGLSEIPGVRIHSQHTNFVFLALAADIGLSLDEFVRLMWEKYNIRMSPYGGKRATYACAPIIGLTRQPSSLP